MHSPFNWAGDLQPEDLERFGVLFKPMVRRVLACEFVNFAPAFLSEEETGRGENGPSRKPAIEPAGNSLSLPLLAEGGRLFGHALARGGDPVLYRSRSQEWLLEKSELLCREMQLIKRLATDPATGLPNGQVLLEQLRVLPTETAEGSTAGKDGPGYLMLIEIYPRARNAEQALLAIAKMGAQLDGFIGDHALLYHLGAGVFAQLRVNMAEEQVLKIGHGILRLLKRENLARAHIGIAEVPGRLSAATGEEGAAEVFRQAWQALGVARRRGPHALCTQKVLACRKDYPFNEIPPAVDTALKRLWRKVTRFGLILLHQDQTATAPHSPVQLHSSADSGYTLLPLSPGEAFVFLPGAGREEVDRWIAEFKARLEPATELSYSMGIALFPCGDFKKSETPLNACKGLRHTRFFGPNSATFFDSASMNISGDIFYEEGDLARAVKEYRRGLGLAPENVNLLNSLGVAYAQMNRYRQAMPFFEKVLTIDPENFMALYNLGYAHLEFSDTAGAVACFTRALAGDEQNFDLLLQLGKLYCRTGKFREAAELLARAELLDTEGRNPAGQGRLCFYLGLACKGLGERQQAIIHLQRAVQCNPQDARAISLLGELYGVEGQGEEIALSLCRQAVELDDSQSEHWRRLGSIQWLRGEEAKAVFAVNQSLRLDRRNFAALRLQGEIFERRGRVANARRTYERMLKIRPGDQEAPEALKRLAGDAAGNPCLEN
jgi:tetratricopeptide (TPR) repeat protein